MTPGALETLDEETLEAPVSRIKNATSAREVYVIDRQADNSASKDRAVWQGMFDGTPPYAPAELKAAGRSFSTNISFGEGEDLLEKAVGSYVDMLHSMETLFFVPTSYGETEGERHENSITVSKEISDMIRRWPLFLTRYLMNATSFVSEAVSFGVFLDHINWQPQIKRLGDVLVPRDSDASEAALERVWITEHMSVTDLWQRIKNEAEATAMGWDVEATKRVILAADNKVGSVGGTKSWEQWATEAKTDDVVVSARTTSVHLIYGFIEEFDGSITQLIFTATGSEQNFLNRRPNAYPNMGAAMVLFAYGVGTTGKIHGLRGLGKKIFAIVMLNNRMYGQHCDGSMLASSLIIKPTSAAALGKAQLSFRGPFTVLHPEAEVVESSVPNFSQNTLPVIQQMRGLLREKSGGYTSATALPDDRGEMSRFEVSARISNSTGMTVTNLLLFIDQFERLLREMVRRIIQPGYDKSMPGGREVQDLYRRLEKKGLPKEALRLVDPDALVATRPIGAGSPAARDEALRILQEMSPGYDEQGRKAVLRHRTANAIGSYQGAEEFITKPKVIRRHSETKTAQLENALMSDGREIEVLSDEMHITHLNEHTPEMEQVIQAVDEGQLTLVEAVTELSLLHQHCVRHLQFIEGDPMAAADTARFRQVLQQTGEILLNGMRQLEAEQRRQSDQGQAPGATGTPDPQQQKFQVELQQKIETHQVNMQLLMEKAQLEQQIALQKAASERAILDAKNAANISPYALSKGTRIAPQ